MDVDLVVRTQRGDRTAYGLLASEIADRFLDVSRRILRDLDLAEDATQQALVKVWRDLPQRRDPRQAIAGENVAPPAFSICLAPDLTRLAPTPAHTV
jgi:hypothetical protein